MTIAALSLLAGGCETLRYYGQAVRGQTEVLLARKPIERVLADPRTSPGTRAQLELVQSLRAFARDELHLPVGKRYASFVQLPRSHVVWNVFAAPEFALTLHRWCYPIVGCVVYRGYFSEASARRLSVEMAQRGYDTSVGGVRAYSTLGWFNDPVLSTFIESPGADLAALIFHELAHSVAFAPGDSDFNESFATFVEGVGVDRWLGGGSGVTRWRSDHAAEGRLVAFVDEWRQRLSEIYAQPLPAADMRIRKAAALDAMRAAYRREPLLAGRYDTFFGAGLNNARLSPVTTYHGHVGAFASLFANCGRDLPAFYAAVSKLARLDQRARSAALASLSPAASASPPTSSASPPTSSASPPTAPAADPPPADVRCPLVADSSPPASGDKGRR